jgi:hypothetical protein
MGVIDWISIGAAFVVTGWFLKIVLEEKRDDERHHEDDARDFFDEHGHWPDEEPAAAEARAARGAESERIAREARRRQRQRPDPS